MKRFRHLVFSARSEIGLKRKNNEDAYGAFPSHGVWCVADGMGGGDDGEIASAAVVQAIDAFCKEYPMPSEGSYSAWEISRGVTAAVNSASSWVFRRAQARRLKGCGSTFAGVVFDATRPADALVMHAGDSRVYRIRGKEIRQITKDHSAAELVGVKKESDLNPMFRGMILRAVGIAESVEVDVTPMRVDEGDVVLVCSDGLSRMIPDKKILSIVRENRGDMNLAVEKLIEAVYCAGAVDNVTAVLISVRALPPAANEVIPPVPLGETEDCSEDPSTHDTSAETGVSCQDTVLTESVPLSSDAEVCRFQTAQRKGCRRKIAAFLRRRRWNPLVVALTGIMLLLAVSAVALAFIRTESRKAARLSPAHSVTNEISRVSTDYVAISSVSENVSNSVKPISQNATSRLESVKAVSPANRIPAKTAVVSEDSLEDRERKKLADILKAERAKMVAAEATKTAEAERCHEAATVLGEICRDKHLFTRFVDRMKSVLGSAACANVRMCGQTIAAMKSEENGFAAAACDLVREMQKFNLLLKDKKYDRNIPRRKFGSLAAMDPTSREAYELAVEIITSVSGNGRRR